MSIDDVTIEIETPPEIAELLTTLDADEALQAIRDRYAYTVAVNDPNLVMAAERLVVKVAEESKSITLNISSVENLDSGGCGIDPEEKSMRHGSFDSGLRGPAST